MKALKHVAGIVLATIGIGFALGSVGDALDGASDTPLWWNAGIFVVLGLAPLAGAVILLRRSATELPPRQCPNCGSTERAQAGVLTKPQTTWLMHSGGWLLASLWGASREQQVRCVQCDGLYFTETRGTRIASIFLWVFLLLMLIGAVARHFEEKLWEAQEQRCSARPCEKSSPMRIAFTVTRN